jgi:hypothetical protein
MEYMLKSRKTLTKLVLKYYSTTRTWNHEDKAAKEDKIYDKLKTHS